jgi:D-alanyl-lipoteichoic acid acyltransferase DltB (MBOAT superfamily)
MSNLMFLTYCLSYLAAAYFALAFTSGRLRSSLFALINIVGVWRLLYHPDNFFEPRWIAIYLVYIALVVAQYLMLTLFAEGPGWRPWLAFFTPLSALILIKYAAPVLGSHLAGRQLGALQTYYFVGISYLAFRASHLVLEIRNGMVKKPGFWEYLAFCFFLPTMSVGPINSYAKFEKGFSGPNRTELPPARCVLRILVGST